MGRIDVRCSPATWNAGSSTHEITTKQVEHCVCVGGLSSFDKKKAVCKCGWESRIVSTNMDGTWLSELDRLVNVHRFAIVMGEK